MPLNPYSVNKSNSFQWKYKFSRHPKYQLHPLMTWIWTLITKIPNCSAPNTKWLQRDWRTDILSTLSPCIIYQGKTSSWTKHALCCRETEKIHTWDTCGHTDSTSVRSLDCRQKWCVCCVGVGVTWSVVLWAGGARRHRDSQPTERVITGSKFSWPMCVCECACVCVPVCSCVFSFPPCSPVSQFHLCYFHPLFFHFSLYHPSLCSAERDTDPLGGQINSPVRAAQSAEGPDCSTETTSQATSSHITHTHTHTHSTRTYAHTPTAFTHWICRASTKHLKIFSISLPSPHPNPTRPPLSEVAANILLGRIVILCSNQWELFCWGLSLSLCIVRVTTTGWYSHRPEDKQSSGWGGGRRKEVWGRRDERWWSRRRRE